MTARIIACVGQKGGVGKSTIARLLAVETIRAGQKARIIDLDPAQGTSTQWQIRRDRNEIDPEVPVEKCRTVEAALRRETEGELLILDGPAFADQLTLKMAKAADLVILPLSFGADDMLPQIEAAYELEDRGIPGENIRLVFCRARGSDEEERQARRYIAPTGLTVFPGRMRDLPSIRQAHNAGRCASETGYPTVDAECAELARTILQFKTEAMA